MQLNRTRSISPVVDTAGARNVWPAVLALFAGAVLFRLINLDYPPRHDELYTLLAARGWLEHGAPRVGDGLYDRAWLYTALVAQFFRVFGESMVAARLPALIAGSLLVVAVFLWTRAVSGAPAAWVAALFMALAPLSIQEGQFARFYALHALAFWLAAIGVYALAERRPGWRAGLAVGLGTVGCLALAWHFQPITLIGLAGVAVWLGLVVGPPWLFTGPLRRWRWFGVAAAAGLLLVAAALAVQSGLAAELWEEYRETPAHAAGRRNEIWHYHLQLIERYPTLWPIFPVTVVFATAAAPRPALFCSCVFSVVFLLLSFGGMKHLNYLFFVYPFLFVIWALALVKSWSFLRRTVLRVTDDAVRRGAPAFAGRTGRGALITVSLAFLVLANGAPARTLLKPFGITLSEDETSFDWMPAREALAPWLERADVVATPHDVHALYYLGDYDLALNKSRLSEIEGDEFAVDPRTGRPVISTVESLGVVIDCYPSGLIVGDERMLSRDWEITPPIIGLLKERAMAVPAPPNLHAFYWEHADGSAAPGACDDLAQQPGTDAHSASTPNPRRPARRSAGRRARAPARPARG